MSGPHSGCADRDSEASVAMRWGLQEHAQVQLGCAPTCGAPVVVGQWVPCAVLAAAESDFRIPEPAHRPTASQHRKRSQPRGTGKGKREPGTRSSGERLPDAGFLWGPLPLGTRFFWGGGPLGLFDGQKAGQEAGEKAGEKAGQKMTSVLKWIPLEKAGQKAGKKAGAKAGQKAGEKAGQKAEEFSGEKAGGRAVGHCPEPQNTGT